MTEATLHDAARSGRLEQLTELLDVGVPVDARDEQGATPLCLAALAEQRETVAILLARGADPRARISKGEYEFHSPVELAMRRAAPDLVEVLLRAGGSYEPDLGGPGRNWKPMNNVFASILLDKGSGGPHGKSYPPEALAEMAKVLVGRTSDAANNTLAAVARLVGSSASERDRNDAREFLAKHDEREAIWAAASAEGFRGERKPGAPPPGLIDRLDDAASRGDAKTVAALLSRRTELRDEGVFDRGHAAPALLNAVRAGHLEVVRVLVGSRIDRNAWTPFDGQYLPETALGIAIEKGYREIARCLVDASARPDLANPWGRKVGLTFERLESFVVDSSAREATLEEFRTRSVLGACDDTAELACLLDEMAKHGGKEESLLNALLLDGILHDDATRVGFLLGRGVSPDTPFGKVPPLDVANRIGAASAARALVDRGARAKRHRVLVARIDNEELPDSASGDGTTNPRS